jgi:molybdate transport system substrate-binding protein
MPWDLNSAEATSVSFINEAKEGKQTMLGRSAKQWMPGVALAATLMSSSFAPAQTTTNINLAVASNFYGFPPSNSAVTDIINAFEMENPGYTVTVVDNGATSTLEMHIIDGNLLGVDLFLAADTATPQDLLVNHFDLVTTYNNSSTPPLYTFNYAQGILALLTNSRWVDVSCNTTGTCGYNPDVYSTAAIADPDLAPYGVAAQSVLTGRYDLAPPLSTNPLVTEYPNITAAFNSVIARMNPVGFVAMSAICSNGGYPTHGNGTSALAYFAIESTVTTPPLLVNNYNPLTQAGIVVKNPNGRTPAQNTELQAFVAFMTDFTSPPTPDSPMMTTLKKFCYSAP